MASGPDDGTLSDARPGRWAIAITGVLAMAVAMGIGRFAFTPILPMMLHDGIIDLAHASWLASANYLGYLVGALLCTFQPLIWRQWPGWPPVHGPAMVRLGLAATVLLTWAMANPWSLTWPWLRFASGVGSALVFVYVSGWCLSQLQRLGVTSLGAIIYTGPGLGIVASGLLASAMVALNWTAMLAWLIFGALALVMTVLVWPVLVSASSVPAASASSLHSPLPFNAPTGRGEMLALTAAYGLAGFGYIITATFLPVIARQTLPASPWLDLFWPIFGLGVVLGAAISSRLPTWSDFRRWLVICYLLQALGIGIGLWSPSLTGFALGSLLLGVPFTAITYFAMQEVRRLRSAQAASYIGLMTAFYGIGQVVGPPMVAWLLRHSASTALGFDLALKIAAGALLLGAAMFAGMLRLYPVRSA